MRATYANCFLSQEQLGDVVLTNEVTVAESLGSTPVRCLGEIVDVQAAERLNAELWQLAFSWHRDGEHDPTVVGGVSVGDLAGAEAVISVLVPAVRGVLEAQAALRELALTEVTVVAPVAPTGNYVRNETMQAHSFGDALSALSDGRVHCTRALSDDPRNEALVRKFARARDPGWPVADTPKRAIAARVLGLADAVAGLNPRAHRPALVVGEYGPTRSFARLYAESSARDLRLVRLWGPPRELSSTVFAGDVIAIPPRPSGRSLVSTAPTAFREELIEHGEAVRHRFVLEGVDLWPLVGPSLVDLVVRYAPFAAVAAAHYRRALVRWRAAAVLVPFDTPPDARLLVRTAQALGIPTFVISDGYKGDDFSQEGMTADIALAWSPGLRDRFFSRRFDGTAIVTGNPAVGIGGHPRAPRPGPRSRILIGSFTFSPIDLNCRRSDPERFLADVLRGVGKGAATVDQVVIKLHPADVTDHYAALLAKYSHLAVEVVATGDVNDMLDSFDLYITTYSTSLIEAVARGIPVVYYQVNQQQLHAPFRDDPFIAARTASSTAELTRLLDEPPGEFATPDERFRWAENYLGPRDGQSVERIIEAIHARAGLSEGPEAG